MSNITAFPARPASVWDAREADWANLLTQSARAAWLVTHGLDAGQIYRAEIYVTGVPFARIFTHAAPPVDVPLDDLPPERLL